MSVEIPEAFRLERAKLVTGRLELDWVRGETGGQFAWTRRNERLSLSRFSLASMLLQNETLDEWARRVIRDADKKTRWSNFEESQVLGCDAVTARGSWKDFRKVLLHRVLDRMRKKSPAPPQLRAWHDEQQNKLFVLKSDIEAKNAHIIDDVLGSLKS